MCLQLGDGCQDSCYVVIFSILLGLVLCVLCLSMQLVYLVCGELGQLGLNGMLGIDQQLSYSLFISEICEGVGSVDVYVFYCGGYGMIIVVYSCLGDYNVFNVSVVGSVVLYCGGINFGVLVGDGFVLVQVDGVWGVCIGYGSDVCIGCNGYVLLLYVSFYCWNQIELDLLGLLMDVELLQILQCIVLMVGSIVWVVFNVKCECILFIDVIDVLGQLLLFVVCIEDDVGCGWGVVGQGGVIQLCGVFEQGQLIVDLDGLYCCCLEYMILDVFDVYGLLWS